MNHQITKACDWCGLVGEHTGFCLKPLSIRDVRVGLLVRPRFDFVDYGGETLSRGEVGIVERVTRCTVHVRDPRGHLHKRFARDFVDSVTSLAEHQQYATARLARMDTALGIK